MSQGTRPRLQGGRHTALTEASGPPLCWVEHECAALPMQCQFANKLGAPAHLLPAPGWVSELGSVRRKSGYICSKGFRRLTETAAASLWAASGPRSWGDLGNCRHTWVPFLLQLLCPPEARSSSPNTGRSFGTGRPHACGPLPGLHLLEGLPALDTLARPTLAPQRLQIQGCTKGPPEPLTSAGVGSALGQTDPTDREGPGSAMPLSPSAASRLTIPGPIQAPRGPASLATHAHAQGRRREALTPGPRGRGLVTSVMGSFPARSSQGSLLLFGGHV